VSGDSGVRIVYDLIRVSPTPPASPTVQMLINYRLRTSLPSQSRTLDINIKYFISRDRALKSSQSRHVHITNINVCLHELGIEALSTSAYSMSKSYAVYMFQKCCRVQ